MKNILILLLSISLFSCNRNAEIEAILRHTDKIMQEQPKEALNMLQAIHLSMIPNGRLHAKYALLYSQALDKNYMDVDNDSLISVAVNYFAKRGDDREKALSYYYQGRVYINAEKTEAAVESFVRAENAANRTDEYYLMGQINYNIGKLYQDQLSLKEAISRYGKAANYFQKCGSEYFNAQMRTHQAISYFAIEKRDSAYIKLGEAKAIYLRMKATDEVAKVEEQIAAIRLDENRNTASIKQDLRRCYRTYNAGETPLQSMGLWQSIYLKENRLDSAKLCGLRILANRAEFTPSQIAGCLVQMEQIEITLRNYLNAYKYCREAGQLIDSIKTDNQEILIQKLERKYNAKILEQELDHLEQRHMYQTIILILIICLFVVAVVCASILIYRWRKRTKYELYCANAEVSRLNTTYMEMSEQLKSLNTTIDLNNDQEMRIYNSIEDRLKRLKKLITEENTSKPSVFIKKFQQYIEIDTNSGFALSDIQYVVNKKHFGIIDYLKLNYPDLSKQDLDLCSLLCLGFTQYGICYMYQYSDIGSFYNKRSRLRKKLGLEQDEKIEDFIHQLLRELSQNGRK